MTEAVSSRFDYSSQFISLDGHRMHYVEQGSGHPIVLVHGVPTSSYLWRNVIPHLSKLGRVIAPDLLGFGKSDKPDIQYTVETHIHYFKAFIEAMKLKKMILVVHGFGSIPGLHYLVQNEKNCRGVVMYEAFLRTVEEDESALPFEDQLMDIQHLEQLHESGVSFVDKMISQYSMRSLSQEELSEYRRPFLDERARVAISHYLREWSDPKAHQKINEMILFYSKKLVESSIPKLMLYSIPGFLTTIATAMWAKNNMPNLEIIDVGEELHLGQESYPHVMGETISAWIQGIEQRKTS